MKFKLCCLVAVIAGAQAVAQTFGGITGVVSDSSGSVIVGATVRATNPQTNVSRTATSNESGNYSFPSLPPGLYDVKAEHQGFQVEVHSGVQLQVQQTARIDFNLNPGAVT